MVVVDVVDVDVLVLVVDVDVDVVAGQFICPVVVIAYLVPPGSE